MIIVDETMSGERLRSFRIDEIHERVTVREIIRARIWQEVQEYNASQRASVFQGLVQPCSTETRLNPFKKAFVPIDWEKQYAEALKGFERNSFFHRHPIGCHKFCEMKCAD